MSLLSPLPNLKFGIFGYPADSAAARDRCLRFLVFLCTRQQLIQQLQRTLKRGNKNKKNMLKLLKRDKNLKERL